MGKLSGTVLILAGISLGTYTLSSLDKGAAKVTAAQTLQNMETPSEAPVPEDLRESSRVRPLAEPAPVAVAPPPQRTEAAVSSRTAPELLPPPPPPPRRARAGGPAVVRIGEAPPRVPVGEPEAMAGPPLDRPALARQIQRQLKRIGCYHGPVTGAWSPSVRQTMKVLMDRANASLPVDQPDPVLLAMVESQATGACSKSCPVGQGRASDGRCLPSAIVAGAGKRRTPAAPGQAGGKTQVRADERSAPADTTDLPPMSGRMSLAGPVAAPARQVRARRGRAATHDRRPSYRAADTRPRGRFGGVAQRPYTGLPGWWPF